MYYYVSVVNKTVMIKLQVTISTHQETLVMQNYGEKEHVEDARYTVAMSGHVISCIHIQRSLLLLYK
jgi:hypothetical protein